MCVIVAAKLPRDIKTGKPTKDAQWRLAKIRDRAYDAEYKIKRYTVSEIGSSQLFLIDTDSDWSEGVSVHEDGSTLMLVNSALNNSGDKKDGTKAPSEGYSSNGKNIRSALKSHNIEDAINILKDGKFDGNTFLSDGKRLFVMECYLPLKVKMEYEEQVGDGRFEDIVPKEKYVVTVKEIKDDWLVVRTNHGVYDEMAGYTPADGESFKSSVNRRELATKYLEAEAFEAVDIVSILSRLGRDSVHKNAFYRPLRVKGEAINKDNPAPDEQIYTTSIIQIDPSGTMFLKPLACKIENYGVNNLTGGKFLANLVVLPEKSRMFESFKDFTLVM